MDIWTIIIIINVIIQIVLWAFLIWRYFKNKEKDTVNGIGYQYCPYCKKMFLQDQLRYECSHCGKVL